MENLTQQQPAQTFDDLVYWSNEFGISQEELDKALKAGEPSTVIIEKYVRGLQLTA